MPNKIIQISNIHKRFGNLHVLKGITHDFEASEVHTIIGPSGSGKSTLIRCLNYLEDFEGSYKFEGKETNLKKFNKIPFRTNFGMVFQHFNLFPHMTVLENVIEAPIHVQAMAKQNAIAQARDLLSLVGIEEKESEYPNSLSGGQKQRVAIARALALRPKVLLFDEPTSALDPEMVGEVLSAIKKLKDEHSFTMIIVTHEMEFAKEISNNVLFMDEGEIVEKGTAQDVFQNPETQRLKDFLKRVN